MATAAAATVLASGASSSAQRQVTLRTAMPGAVFPLMAAKEGANTLKALPAARTLVELIMPDPATGKLNLSGVGLVTKETNAVHLLAKGATLDQYADGHQHWKATLSAALEWKSQLLNVPNHFTNTFRWINSAGDGAPGIYVDVFGETAIATCPSEAARYHIYPHVSDMAATKSWNCYVGDSLQELTDAKVGFTSDGIRYEDNWAWSRYHTATRQMREVWFNAVNRLMQANDSRYRNQPHVLDLATDCGTFSAIASTEGARTLTAALDVAHSENLKKQKWALVAQQKTDKLKEVAAAQASFKEEENPFWQCTGSGHMKIVRNLPPRYFPLVSIQFDGNNIGEQEAAATDENSLLFQTLGRVANNGLLFVSCVDHGTKVASWLHKAVAASRRDVRVVRRIGPGGDFTVSPESTHHTRTYFEGVVLQVGA